MESLANNHAFIDGNERVSFVMTDAMLRAHGYFLDLEPFAGHKLITEAMEKNGFRFPMIRDWVASIVKPLARIKQGAKETSKGTGGMQSTLISFFRSVLVAGVREILGRGFRGYERKREESAGLLSYAVSREAGGFRLESGAGPIVAARRPTSR